MKISSLLFTFILFFSLSVNAQVTAEFTAPDTICAGVQTEFIANSTNVTEFHWIYGDDPYYPGSSTGPNPIADPTYWQAGTYLVTLIVTGTPNNVKDTVQKAIYVRPTPKADFRIDPY